MAALRTSLKRQMKAFVAVLAAMVIALTSLVVAAPSADAAYRWHCTVAKTVVHRGDHDAALCKNGPKHHRGHAYVLRHGRRHYVLLKTFRTGRRGNALFGFRIKPRVPLGRVRVHVTCGSKRTSFIIFVKRRRHHHH
jgi:hypothetical protein